LTEHEQRTTIKGRREHEREGSHINRVLQWCITESPNDRVEEENVNELKGRGRRAEIHESRQGTPPAAGRRTIRVSTSGAHPARTMDSSPQIAKPFSGSSRLLQTRLNPAVGDRSFCFPSAVFFFHRRLFALLSRSPRENRIWNLESLAQDVNPCSRGYNFFFHRLFRFAFLSLSLSPWD